MRGSLFPQALRDHQAESKILLAFLAMAATLFSLIWFVSEVLEGDTLAIDRLILRGLRTASDPAIPIGPKWLVEAMVAVTSLGSFTVLTLLTVLAAGFLVTIGKRSTALFVIVAITSGALLSTGLKSIFFRARPDVVPHLIQVTSPSFPSGHAMNSAVVYLTLAALIPRTQHGVATRVYLVGVAILLTVLVGMSRVYLGVHWPSDVVAGWSIGALWALFCSLFSRRQIVSALGS